MKDRTRRVKDILTPLGATPHPPRSLALVATGRLPLSPSKRRATSHSQIPHVRKVPRKNGKIVPRALNFSSVLMNLILRISPRAVGMDSPRSWASQDDVHGPDVS